MSIERRVSFTIVAVAALALGLGANAALWTVVSSVLLRPLPYAQPERLIAVEEVFLPSGRGPASPGNARDWREQSHSFTELVPFHVRSRNLQGVAEPERVVAALADAGLFTALGVEPLLGRTRTD
jgi:hypothetical protein